MRRTFFAVLPLLVCGCDDFRGPNLSLPTNSSNKSTERATGRYSPGHTKGPLVYGGKTAEQWGKLLEGRDREEIMDACRALHVLGREGRQHLFQGLNSANPETRRLCLETMTIADFKKFSEDGRKKLVVLAGDPDDMRIRDRAHLLLAQWHGSIPAP